jgi:hypothetical protein
VSPGFGGFLVPVAPGQRGARQRCPPAVLFRRWSDETIFQIPRSRLETKMRSNRCGSDNGVDHVEHHHQPDLPPVSQKLSSRCPKAPLGLMLPFRDPTLSKSSVGQVEADRLIDVGKPPIEPGQRQDILGLLQAAANDNQLAWPFIPFRRAGTAPKPSRAA